MFQRRPALRFVLLFASGIILAEWISFSPVILFSFTTFLIVLSIIIFLSARWISINPAGVGLWQFRAMILLQCSVLLLGILLQTIQHSDYKSRRFEPKVKDEYVTVFGNIDTELLRQEQRISFVINADSIIRYKRIDHDSRRVMVSLRPERGERYAEKTVLGKKIILCGILEPFPFQRNPGEYNFGKYLELNDIDGIVSVQGWRNVEILGNADKITLQSWVYSAQRALYRIIDKLHSQRHASFLKGIVFGYRAEIPPDVKQSFMDTGTIHILAVSGSNVAFVAFMFFSFFGFFRLSRKAVVCAAIIGLTAYMLITGSSASVVRATIMAVVILGGTLMERKADIYNSIFVAASILLIWNTKTLFDVGFQLSFAAVISIVYFYPRLESLIKIIPDRYTKIIIVDIALKLSAVSLAAQLGTIPFTAYYFCRVSVVSLLANVPVVPISGLNTFIGFAEVLAYFISPWIAGLYAAANDFLVWFLLGFVRQASNFSFAYLETWQFGTVTIAGYYILLVGTFNLNNPRARAWMLISILIIGNYTLFESVWTYTHPKLIATAIDVGQGDAILVEFPNSKKMLIDTGPSSLNFDTGERTVIPFLRRKGIAKLDYMLITHPHSDHIGGAKSVLKSIHIDTLVINSDSAGNRQIREVYEVAQERGVKAAAMFAGNQIQIDPNTRVYVLYPKMNKVVERNANNSSMVIKILYGSQSILLVGDAEVAVEKRLIARYGKFLSAGILKIGHHGSNSSTSAQFLESTHPQTAVISVGVRNRFQHPSALTLNRLKFHSVETKRTDKQGAIILENNGMKWTKREWR